MLSDRNTIELKVEKKINSVYCYLNLSGINTSQL